MSGKLGACIFGIVGFFIVLDVCATPLNAQSIEEKVQVCAGCHGQNGKPVDKTIAVIWGQQQGYLYIQLRDFKRATARTTSCSRSSHRWNARTCWLSRNISRKSRGPTSANPGRQRKLQIGPCAPMLPWAVPAAIWTNSRATAPYPFSGHEQGLHDENHQRFSFARARQQSRHVRLDACHCSR